MEKKTKFRSRKLDFNKSLQVFRDYEIEDLEEAISASRSVPLVASGVDKEEEEAAINASQANSQPVYIPTPDASQFIDDYDELYKPTFKPPKSLITVTSTLEEFFDPPGVWYCIDDDDASWLKESANIDQRQMEILISKLEFVANDLGFSNITEAYLSNFDHLNIPSEVMKSIFSYWHTRRIKFNGSVRPTLKFEDVSKTADHYVCFRRREIKFQHRKTRRSDALCLEKLRRLRSDMESVRTLLEMVSKREKFKKESFLLDQLIFEQARTLEKWNTKYNIPVKTGSSLKVLATAYAGAKLKRRAFEGGVAEPSIFGNESGKVVKRMAIPEQFSKVDELLHTEVNRFQVARDMMKQLKGELERRVHLDRDFDDRTLEMQSEAKVPYAETFYRPSRGTFVRYRLGRGGRLMQDRRCAPTQGRKLEGLYGKNFPLSLRFFSGPELAICNNSQVQNYNQHYISATSQLMKPVINYTNLIASSGASGSAVAMLGSTSVGFPPSSITKKKRKLKKESEASPIQQEIS